MTQKFGFTGFAEGLRVVGGTTAMIALMAGLPQVSGSVRDAREAAAAEAEAQRFIEASRGDALNLFEESAEIVKIAALTIESAADTIEPLTLSRPLDDLLTFDFAHLAEAEDAAAERQCLSEAIYYEARGETVQGQLAVAEVVLNRVRHRAYPDSICGVVYQGSERGRGCQFTFTCDGSKNRPMQGRAWERSEMAARHALMGFSAPVTSAATHYHTVAVSPVWSNALVPTRQIGVHLFYRMPAQSELRRVADREA